MMPIVPQHYLSETDERPSLPEPDTEFDTDTEPDDWQFAQGSCQMRIPTCAAVISGSECSNPIWRQMVALAWCRLHPAADHAADDATESATDGTH